MVCMFFLPISLDFKFEVYYVAPILENGEFPLHLDFFDQRKMVPSNIDLANKRSRFSGLEKGTEDLVLYVSFALFFEIFRAISLLDTIWIWDMIGIFQHPLRG